MPFNAVVVRVLVASPGDTGNARRVLRELMEDWNSLNAEATGVMLLPVLWERDTVPEMGNQPQAIINRQIVDVADVLVGVFWTRLGTPTAEADSGTVAEIERFVAAGKPVLLYFSDEPVVPGSVDLEQYERLREFRDRLRNQGLFDSYSNDVELWRKATKAITRMMRDSFGLSLADSQSLPAKTRPSALLVVRVDSEREVSGFDSKGRPRYRSRERLVVENRGTAAAEQLRISVETAGDASGGLPHVHGINETAARLAPGGALNFPLLLHMGVADQWDVVLRWREGDAAHEDRQTVRA